MSRKKTPDPIGTGVLICMIINIIYFLKVEFLIFLVKINLLKNRENI